MKDHSKTKQASAAGFTLVEVMVTLLIMSLMLVAITQVLAGARRTRDVIHNVQESQLAGPAILDLVEADLRGLITTNRQILDTLRVQDNAIGGMDADRLDFVTTSNNRMLTPNDGNTRYLRADVSEVGYAVKTNRDYEGEFLEIWRRESFGIDEEPFSGGKFTFLHERVRRFDIQVFAEDGTEAEPLESWGIANADEEFRGLPSRLEIELEIELAPRLINEQSTRMRQEKRRVLYRRIVHFPERLHIAMDVRPVPRIPDIKPVEPEAAGGSQDTGSGATFTSSGSGGLGAPPPPGNGQPPIDTGGFGGGGGGSGAPPIFGTGG